MRELLIGIAMHEAGTTLHFPLFILKVMRRLKGGLMGGEITSSRKAMRCNVMHYEKESFA